jgi:hypothetical protein
MFVVKWFLLSPERKHRFSDRQPIAQSLYTSIPSSCSLWFGVRLASRPITCLFYQPQMTEDYEEFGGMSIGRGNGNTRRKSAPVPFCLPQIPHDLTWDRARAAAVENRWLTVWTVARSMSQKTVLCSPDSYQSMLCRGRLWDFFISSVSYTAALRIYSTITYKFHALLLLVTTTILSETSLWVSSHNLVSRTVYRVLRKNFTTIKVYIHLFRGHVQCFELS